MRYTNVVVSRRGDSGGIEVTTRESAPPGPGQVLIRLVAAGVSYGDVLLREGVIPGAPKPPFVPGYDAAGVVEAVGDGVSGLAAGQWVCAIVRGGGYSEFLTAPADRVVPLPDGVDPVEVAAMALNYFVAYQMLHRVAHARPGQTAMVHGAAGGVGTALLELAALAGVKCFGSASPGKREVVTSLGAEYIDYRAEDFVNVVRGRPGWALDDTFDCKHGHPRGGVDMVFDAVGGTHFMRSYRALNRPGTLVAYGQSQALHEGNARTGLAIFGFLGGIFAPKLIPDGRRTVFYNAWSLEKKEPRAYRDDMTKLLDLLAAGEIKPVIARTLPLSEARAAQGLLEKSAVAGKIVLICDDDAPGERTRTEDPRERSGRVEQRGSATS
ncbi:medium chain dehydrogenase/reductase family protein [Actinoallomurus bryophytorum]|uniref:NADPH:quinone reductase-like Zn-dependent oxidoreductase n=1 Tax=Actinoallomurus bryophytorum TaxID=1490222 RepID=A0A543CUU2_9ACTN|nr:medium chain dehydrogenase/reductase family protein [Actinoallomurus bryophytorum]TQM00821.1 NADPH:quinone reductase-like Zn-dependent oxidoreductase [Actinoallomurus bryophytorum]